MSQKLRQEQILEILKKERFVTVQYLVKVLQYSTATINRDLNTMQALKLVKRSHGSVQIFNGLKDHPPLPMREFYQQSEKRKIAEEACKQIRNGDTVFLFGTTTVRQMVSFLAKKKDLTIISNSTRICLELAEFDFEVICLGGRIKVPPHILFDDMTVENAMRFHVDKMFFSTKWVTKDGLVENNVANLLNSVMIKNSKEIYLLADKTKLADKIEYSLCDFSVLSGVIANFDFPEETKKAYPNVEFICTE